MNTLVIISLLLLALCAFCVLYYFVFIRPKHKVKKSATTKEPPPSPTNSPPIATKVCVPDESEYLTTRPIMGELVRDMSAKHDSVRDDSMRDDSVRDSIVTLEPIKTDPITNEPIEENTKSLVDDLTVGGAIDTQTTVESSSELIDDVPDDDSDVKLDDDSDVKLDDDSDDGSDDVPNVKPNVKHDVKHDDASDSASDDDSDDATDDPVRLNHERHFVRQDEDEYLSAASMDSDKARSDESSIEDNDDAPKEFTFVPTLKQKRKAALFKVQKA